MTKAIVRCENVSKKFCRDLKTSLWYGVRDSVSDLFAAKGRGSELREGEFWANKNICFELQQGECLGLIGHNGAGKTTLLKLLSGLLKPNVGAIEIQGRVGALIALGAGFNPVLTGRENVYINSAILGRSRKETDSVFDEIVSFAELEDSIDAPVRNYSSGMQVRLGFAIASQLNPDLLLVDEVLAVGDNAFQKKCYDRVHEMRTQGTSFIVVSHNPYQLERLCDKVAAMSDGGILKLADPKEAIHLYHTELQKRQTQKTQPSTAEQESTGEVRIGRVYLESESGRETSELSTGDALTISTECQFSSPLTDLRLRLCIYSMSNVLIATIGSGSQFEVRRFVPGTSTLRFQIASCNLLAGEYTIEAVLVSASGLRLARVNDAATFSIETSSLAVIEQTAATGLVYVPGTWS